MQLYADFMQIIIGSTHLLFRVQLSMALFFEDNGLQQRKTVGDIKCSYEVKILRGTQKRLFLDPERQAKGSYTITFLFRVSVLVSHRKFVSCQLVSVFVCQLVTQNLSYVIQTSLTNQTHIYDRSLRSPGVAGDVRECTPISLTNLMRGICKRRALVPCDFVFLKFIKVFKCKVPRNKATVLLFIKQGPLNLSKNIKCANAHI